MRLRQIALGALAVTLAATPSAAFAKVKPKPPKVYCNLLTDGSGDGNMDVLPVASSPALDIVSADLATGPKKMVVVLRLADLSKPYTSDPWMVTEYSWGVGFTSTLGQQYGFTVSRTFDGNFLSAGATVDNAGIATNFKPVGNTLTWTVERKAVPALARAGNKFFAFRAHSSAFSSSADSADMPATVTYPDRGLSCVHSD